MGERTIVGLDIGTSVIRVVIAEVNDEGKLTIVSTATHASAGVQNGVIVNIEAAKDAIREAVEAAENSAGVAVDSVIVSIGGSSISSQSYRGITPIMPTNKGGVPREITRDDVNRAIDIATAINIPVEKEKIHVVPQDYIVDGVGGIPNPVNRIGLKLEVDVHVILASRNIIRNLSTTIQRANYILDGVMLKTLGQTKSVCHQDEMELGSIIIDLGAGTTDVIVLIDDAPVCTASIKVGGNLVTNDIAVVTGIPVSVAETIKIESGCCWLMGIEDDDRDIILPGVGGRAPEILARSQLCQIIQARMEQIFRMVKAAIVKNSNNSIKQLSGNIILTGGGAQMEGIVELTQAVFNTSSVRLGIPDSLGGPEAEYRRPDFATAVGLVVANKDRPQTAGRKKNRGNKNSKSGDNNKDSILKRIYKTFF